FRWLHWITFATQKRPDRVSPARQSLSREKRCRVQLPNRSVSSFAGGNGCFCFGVGMCHVAYDVLWRARLIEIKSPEIFAHETQNHQLNPGKQNDAAEHGRNAQREVRCDPDLVDQNENQREYAQTRSQQSDVN